MAGGRGGEGMEGDGGRAGGGGEERREGRREGGREEGNYVVPVLSLTYRDVLEFLKAHDDVARDIAERCIYTHTTCTRLRYTHTTHPSPSHWARWSLGIGLRSN